MYDISQEIQAEVKGRDGPQCFLTRTAANDNWIFPPMWALLFGRNLYKISERGSFNQADNAAMMCEDVAQLLHMNAIGIDVDEEYRVVVFEPHLVRSGPDLQLPPAVAFLGQSHSMDKYLREHFR
ncbi:hypothetical protein OF83DRAFT_936884 [Amylostereum chailletii]|nr:hypothetical protein OF83DRAFT_936884 [Amylostereum chailletii]